MDWLRQTAAQLREWLMQQAWLDGWQTSIAQAPDWALLAAGPAMMLLSALVLRLAWPGSRTSETCTKRESAPAQSRRAPEPPHVAPMRPTPAQLVVSHTTTPKLDEEEDNRSVRVFVSSTFLDMQRERDELVTKTFPSLRAKYRARGVELFEVDLRWGITKEQQERGEALPTLLAEIDRCRPYFIGLLGDRYGWVPPPAALTEKLKADYPVLADAQGASVTAMEIMHGVLSDPDTAARAFIFERDSNWDWRASLMEADRASAGEEPEAARAKLADIKARIGQRARIEPYTRPEEIGPKVTAALDALLEARFPEAEAPDVFEQTARLHRAYARERRGLHVGAEGYIRDLNRWMEAKDAAPLLITGASGSGKSTLVANWLHTWRKAHPNDIVFEHYLGASSDSADPMLIMRRLWEHLNRAAGETIALPGDNAELMNLSAALAQRLAQVGVGAERSGIRVLIALDGLDKLSREQNLRWLPIAPRVHWLASSLPCEAQTAALARGFAPRDVRPLSEQEQRDFIAGTLARWRRALEQQHIARLLQPAAQELAGSPLYLRTVLEELRVSADHSRLTERLEDYRGARDMSDLFDRVLRRLDEDCEPGLVATTLPLVWASRAGLEEAEILAITGASPLAWATLRDGLGDGLRDQQGRIAFGHDYLGKAVATRYLGADEDARAAHLTIADHFSNHPDIGRRAEEWPWQLARAKQNAAFEDAVFSIDNVALFLEHDCRARLFEYWSDYDRKGNRAIAAFAKRWSTYHSEIEGALERENTAYFNPKYLVVPELCRLLLQRSERGPFAAEVAHYFLEVLSHSDEIDDEFRGNLLNALLLARDTGNPARALEVLEALNSRFGQEWRGSGRIALSIAGLEGDIRAALTSHGEDELGTQEALLERMRRELGPDNRSTLIRANNLAGMYSSLGRHSDAERLHRDTFERRLRILGADAEDTLISLSNLATSVLAQGRYDDAEALLKAALTAKESTLGGNHYSTLISAFTYAQVLIALGHTQRAKSMLREVVDAATEAELTHEAFFKGAQSLLRSLNGL